MRASFHDRQHILAGTPRTMGIGNDDRYRICWKVAWTTAAIVLIQPLFALGITKLFRMSHDEIRGITLISAIPEGFFGLVF
jgi:hypothetical protein